VIGIGAGPGCDGQILVLYDILGISFGRMPKFSRNFLSGADSVEAAISAYAEAVRAGHFPAVEHTFE
jgi:3-methyl-2-oxobutanoate hydroxymethyltransferase